MKLSTRFGLAILGLVLIALAFWYVNQPSEASDSVSFTEIEAGFGEEMPAGSVMDEMDMPDSAALLVGRGQYTIDEIASWERPAGPPRVGLQIGHLDSDQVPEELSGLTRNGAGAVAGPYNERDTMAVIVEIAAEQLRAAGIEVDVLPATIPPGYVADAFVAVHADGNNNTSVRGYKMAAPRRDYAGTSQSLTDLIYESYEEATGLPEDFSISRRMTAYYAFNWPRYEHAIHPRTPAVIVETGFLSNPTDRAFLLNEPERAAEGIVNGVLAFLAADLDPIPTPQPLITPTLPLTGTVACSAVRAERRDGDREYPCEAALFDQAGNQYLLVAEEPIATSSLPYEATVDGIYRPAQVLDNYFWFPYEILGLIQDPTITRLE